MIAVGAIAGSILGGLLVSADLLGTGSLFLTLAGRAVLLGFGALAAVALTRTVVRST